ncbi:MAG: enoyl-CoA hydratase-related protein [Acidobacteriota bacterium]|nr:enoyl-CoA hydratase-related protein [Acidobacteriota bacterium]
MNDLETLRFELADNVARITLDRPDAANAMNLRMTKDLLEVGIECDENPEVRAVLLRSEGRMFCAGGDLASFAKAGAGLPRGLKEMTVYLHAAITRLTRGRAPAVAAVQGPAAGAGFSLACAADLVVASEQAVFTMAYTRAGLTPDGSSTYFLPRLLGRHRALELILTNRTLSAAEAQDWGIVNEVVPADELDARAGKLAKQLAAGPTRAFGAAKELVMRSFSEDLESQMEFESQAIANAARTEDAAEGIAAFFEKRRADFRGR